MTCIQCDVSRHVTPAASDDLSILTISHEVLLEVAAEQRNVVNWTLSGDFKI